MPELKKRHKLKSDPTPNPSALIGHATTSAQPLVQHDANVLADICHSLRGLEEVTRTTEGKAKLVDYLGPPVARNVIDFWEDEWLADQ